MRHHRHAAGFTLLEILVVTGIIVVLMTVLVSMTNQTQRLVKSTSSKVEQFQTARVAFEAMTRKLAHATLNTFWDYDYYDPNTGFTDTSLPPTRYMRNSDLRFRIGLMNDQNGLNPGDGSGRSPGTGPVSPSYPGGNPQVGVGVFFNAPFGVVSSQDIYGSLDSSINSSGFFVEIGDDSTTIPSFISTPVPPLVPVRRRFRLMEMIVPTEEVAVFKPTAQAYSSQAADLARSWFLPFIDGADLTKLRTRVMAENIILLTVVPRLSSTDEKAWRTLNGLDDKRPPQTLAGPGIGFNYDTTLRGNDETGQVTAGWLNTKHQLPPVLDVVMVAIDEASAMRLQDKYPDATTNPGLGITTAGPQASQIYTDTGGNQLFVDQDELYDRPWEAAASRLRDLSKFETFLQANKISYRIFSSKISVLGAKWSRAQIDVN